MKNWLVCQRCGRVVQRDLAARWLVSPKRGDQDILIVRCPKHITEHAMRMTVEGRTAANRQKMAEGQGWDEPFPPALSPFPIWEDN
jgi:hypothetical protein